MHNNFALHSLIAYYGEFSHFVFKVSFLFFLGKIEDKLVAEDSSQPQLFKEAKIPLNTIRLILVSISTSEKMLNIHFNGLKIQVIFI